MIDTEKLLKKRSDSTVINSNINSKNTTVNWNWSNNILVKELSYERNSIGLIGKQSKEKIIINEKKHRSTIRKLFKLLKAAFVQMEKQNMKLNTTEMIMIEWKELGRRVEYIMLFLSLFTIIITPIWGHSIQYNDTQYNDTQYNDTQYNDTHYNDTQCIAL